MLSLIEVKCPHCGAHGQIMLPPVGTIIVGPCPECQGLVVVFCGHVLALQSETMLQGTIQDKREHMMSVLTDFLKDRIVQMIPEESESEKQEPQPALEATEEAHTPALPHRKSETPRKSGTPPRVPISEDEAKWFSDVDLKLLDNKDYFKTIFG
jgi:hypothetical protein